jgi:hypothetical protein
MVEVNFRVMCWFDLDQRGNLLSPFIVLFHISAHVMSPLSFPFVFVLPLCFQECCLPLLQCVQLKSAIFAAAPLRCLWTDCGQIVIILSPCPFNQAHDVHSSTAEVLINQSVATICFLLQCTTRIMWCKIEGPMGVLTRCMVYPSFK